MDRAAHRIAQQYVRAHAKLARYPQEFLQTVEGRRFRNPDTDNDVLYVSLPDHEQARIYEMWSKSRGGEEDTSKSTRKREEDVSKSTQKREEKESPKRPEKLLKEESLDLARTGEVTKRKQLSAGGQGQPGMNQSEIVTLKKDGKEQVFIRKPADGEEKYLRIGIPGGTYHAREAAAFSLDDMLGPGGIVPPTVTRGKDDGSYQAWSEGSLPMHGDDLNELVKKVPMKDLAKSPSFHRLQLLDLVLGHEDRHRGNLLFKFNGEEKPENLEMVAIDNGLALSNPLDNRDQTVYYNPFQTYYYEDEEEWKPGQEAQQAEEDKDLSTLERLKKRLQQKEVKDQIRVQDQAEEEGDKLVADSLRNIRPELHEQLKKIDLGEAAKKMVESGVQEEGAIRAALNRIAAMQDNPKAFDRFYEEARAKVTGFGKLENAWKDFQHASGTGELLEKAGASGRKSDVDKAVSGAKPEDGWIKPPSLKDAQKAMRDLNAFGDTAAPDDKTKPSGGSEDYDEETDFSMLANRVASKWISGKVARGGRKLTVYYVGSGRPKVLGEFELYRDKTVDAKYKDRRFQSEIERQGVRLMGQKFKPEDGPKFMNALLKTYGSRSMYDVVRS